MAVVLSIMKASKECWLIGVLTFAGLLLLLSSRAEAHEEVEREVHGNYEELSRDQLHEVLKLQGAFREIESVIGQEKNNFNPVGSIEAAKAMQRNSSRAFGLFNGKLNDALKIFISLPKVIANVDSKYNRFCNYEGYEILAKNFALNPSSGHLTTGTSVLYHYARQHALECLPQYELQFAWDSNEVGIYQNLRLLNYYLAGLQLDDFTPEAELQEAEAAQHQQQLAFVDANLNTFDIRASGLKKILSRMGYQTWRKVTGENRSAIKTRIEAELLNPCGIYVEGMRKIFAPAKVDLFMSRVSNEVPVPEFSKQFMDSWMSYRICLYLHRADRRDMVSRFLKAISIV